MKSNLAASSKSGVYKTKTDSLDFKPQLFLAYRRSEQNEQEFLPPSFLRLVRLNMLGFNRGIYE